MAFAETGASNTAADAASAVAAVAAAQAAAATLPPAILPLATPAPAAAPAEPDTVLVTGSRIKRRELDSVAPMETIDSKYLDSRGFSTMAQALNELPSFGVPGASPIGFGQSNFGAGQSFVNFLGLGS